MDANGIAVLAASAVTALLPFLPLIATKAAEKLGEGLPAAVGKLWTGIRKRMDVKENTREAVDDLLKHPEDPEYATVFKIQLQKLLDNDDAFRSEMQKLLEGAVKEGGTHYTATVWGSGAIAQGPGARAVGAGGIMISGDEIPNKPEKK